MMNVPLIILYYIRTFLFPFNLGIAQHWVITTPGLYNFILPLFGEIILFSLATVYFVKSKSKIFLFFFLWLLIGLLPHLQIVPINMTVAERWLYFPMIGMLGVLAESLKLLSPEPVEGKAKKDSLHVNKSLRMTGMIIIIFLFFVRSFVRTLDWRNGLALYGSTISSTSSFDMQNNMGVELFRIGKYNEAKKYFEKSVKLAPYWWVNWNNLGAIYEQEKNFTKAQEYYERSVNNGDYQLAYENLAKTLVIHRTDKQKAKVFLQKALLKFPEDEILKALERELN